MKTRVVVAVVLIVFSLMISFFSFFYVQTVSRQLENCLVSAAEKYSNGLDTSKEINSALALWKKHQKAFGSFLKHSDAEELGKCFSLVEIFSIAQSDELEEALTQCLVSLQITMNGEKLTAENIF